METQVRIEQATGKVLVNGEWIGNVVNMRSYGQPVYVVLSGKNQIIGCATTKKAAAEDAARRHA